MFEGKNVWLKQYVLLTFLLPPHKVQPQGCNTLPLDFLSQNGCSHERIHTTLCRFLCKVSKGRNAERLTFSKRFSVHMYDDFMLFVVLVIGSVFRIGRL